MPRGKRPPNAGQDEFEEEFGREPGKLRDEDVLTSTETPTGLRFGLKPEFWKKWWLGIPQVDRDAFRFHGGNVGMSKFVCCFEFYSQRGKEKHAPHIHVLIQAYATAYEADTAAHLTRISAAEEYEHPAVQFLLDQFEYREIRASAARLETRWTQLGTMILDQALLGETPLKERIEAFRGVGSLYKMLSLENIADRAIRSKSAVAEARKRQLSAEKGEDDQSLSEAQITAHVGELLNTFGEERIVAMLALAKAKPEPKVVDILDMSE